MARSRTQPQFLPSEEQQNLLLAKSDALSALVVWALLEGLSWVVLPFSSQFFPKEKLMEWVIVSIPIGLVGAGLIGLSSWLVKRTQEKIDRRESNKPLFVSLSQAVGWVGLAGISFPMAIVGLELWLMMSGAGAE